MATFLEYSDSISLSAANTDMDWLTISGTATTGGSLNNVVSFKSNPGGATFGEPLNSKPETEKEWLRRRVDEMLWRARN